MAKLGGYYTFETLVCCVIEEIQIHKLSSARYVRVQVLVYF
ncbi:MAG: hypothetical protein WBX95_20945 [Xanthobacteraceae bacterium]